MEIHQLEILRELGALGSVKAVADTLMVTPSAVSQQLALLQRTVEVPLTRKEGRNLVLTEAGQVLADAGAAVVSAMADAKGALGSYHGSPAVRAGKSCWATSSSESSIRGWPGASRIRASGANTAWPALWKPLRVTLPAGEPW